jgi:hypothetical protein
MKYEKKSIQKICLNFSRTSSWWKLSEDVIDNFFFKGLVGGTS